MPVTFSVDMSRSLVSSTGVYLAGGAFFGEPKDEYKMTYADGDKVYEITVNMPVNTHQHYAFTNGDWASCGNWECKEDLSHSEGGSCSRSENWNVPAAIAAKTPCSPNTTLRKSSSLPTQINTKSAP